MFHALYVCFPLLSRRKITLLTIPMPPNAAQDFDGKTIPAATSPTPTTKLHTAAAFNAFFFGLGSVTEISNALFNFSQV